MFRLAEVEDEGKFEEEVEAVKSGNLRKKRDDNPFWNFHNSSYFACACLLLGAS